MKGRKDKFDVKRKFSGYRQYTEFCLLHTHDHFKDEFYLIYKKNKKKIKNIDPCSMVRSNCKQKHF